MDIIKPLLHLAFLVIFIGVSCESSALQGQSLDSQKAPKPNIILILADDLGFGDLSSAGHPSSSSPVLDRLASQGRFLTNSYVTSPICSPSRASLLTGRYQPRTGVYPGVFIPDNVFGLPHNETTLAEVLKGQGYRTSIIGKWHLGVGRNLEYLPTHHGFDEYLGIPYSHDMCPCLKCFPNNQPCFDTCWEEDVSCPLFSNASIVEQPADLTSLTTRYVDGALRFINRAAKDKKPFFLYLPFHQVHHPQFASRKFHGRSPRGRFGDALAELDWAVGEVMDFVRNLGIEKDTVVWFTSDNGPSLTRHDRGGCAGPLRCGKGTTWEGGVRVPTFVVWPGHIKPGRSHALCSTLEVVPTLARLAGASVGNLTLDGVDLMKVLLNPDAKSPREFLAMYPESPHPEDGPSAVYHGGFKAHFFTEGNDLSDADNYDPMCPSKHRKTRHDPPLLYDLLRDPGERYDLAGQTEYQSLLATMEDWRTSHMKAMTWMPPQTLKVDKFVQPCCTRSNCQPFPACCNCPRKDLEEEEEELGHQYGSGECGKEETNNIKKCSFF
ncbi:arylsulfatase A-like isoform X2 [Oratosquilla oratoria]